MTSTWNSNEIALAEAPTYKYECHHFKLNFLKSIKYKNYILKHGEYEIKTQNAGLFCRHACLTQFRLLFF